MSSKVYNVTAAADVSIATCVEGSDSLGKPNGIYTITLGATVTAGNILQLKPVKAGFDFSQVTVKTFASV